MSSVRQGMKMLAAATVACLLGKIIHVFCDYRLEVNGARSGATIDPKEEGVRLNRQLSYKHRPRSLVLGPLPPPYLSLSPSISTTQWTTRTTRQLLRRHEQRLDRTHQQRKPRARHPLLQAPYAGRPTDLSKTNDLL